MRETTCEFVALKIEDLMHALNLHFAQRGNIRFVESQCFDRQRAQYCTLAVMWHRDDRRRPETRYPPRRADTSRDGDARRNTKAAESPMEIREERMFCSGPGAFL